MKKGILIFITILFSMVSSQVFAIPELQLYIEGATYDTGSETWVTTDNSFKLWVIGDVGAKGSILNVRLTAAFPTSETGTITLTPATTSLLTDPSMPGIPVLYDSPPSTDGTIPLKTDGTQLGPHGIYGDGTSWNGYDVGDFILTDSPIGDFINTFPISFPDLGQINAYSVSITGYSMVHFDAFNTIEGERKAKFAPFSHDAEQVPEPGTLMLLGPGLIGIGLYRWRRKKG